MPDIGIDTEVTLQAAGQLERVSAEVRDALQQLHAQVQEMYAAGFEGRFVSAFEADWQFWAGEAEKTSTNLEECGRDLRSTAEVFLTQDQEGASRFTLDQSGGGRSGGGSGARGSGSSGLESAVDGTGWSLSNEEGFHKDELLDQIGGSCTIYGIMNLLVEEGIDISQAEADAILQELTEKYGRDQSFPFDAAQDILERYGVDYTAGNFNVNGQVDVEAAEQFLIENLQNGNPVYVWAEVDDSFGMGNGGHAETVVGVQTDDQGNLVNVLVATNWDPPNHLQTISADAFLDDWSGFNNQAFYVTVP